MNFEIRDAQKSDSERITKLFIEMLRTIYHTENVQGYDDGYLDKFFTKQEDQIFVAADKDSVIGFLSVEVHRESDRVFLYLDDFSVSEDYRNQGIGTALIQKAEALAKDMKISDIFLHVEKENLDARRFYERLGYSISENQEHRYLMYKNFREEKMKYEVLNHACVRIEGSKVLYFDPFKIETAPHDADYIFITHSHYDHESPEDIEKVKNEGTVLISYKDMKPGEEKSFNGLNVKAIAAYNKLKPFHIKANGWLGYLISLDGMEFYIAGDTDNTPEAREVRCDVCFIPVGGKYTCDAKQGAELAKAIAPRIEAIPYHYGSIVGTPEDAELFRKLLK